jgi:nicotinamidase-related amidase
MAHMPMLAFRTLAARLKFRSALLCLVRSLRHTHSSSAHSGNAMRTLVVATLTVALSLLQLGCEPEEHNAYENEYPSANVSILRLVARSQTRSANDPDRWAETEEIVHWKSSETAIIITDMWDQHWCDGASDRVAAMAPRVNAVVQVARAKGVTIIHAPSSVMDYYAGHPGRTRMMQAPSATPPSPIKGWYHLDELHEAPLPIDDTDGGCDTCPPGGCDNVGQPVWTRQIETIEIVQGDGISDIGEEIHNYLRHKGIRNVILMGVHTNMCMLGRPFGLRAQRTMGMNVVLVRDLTDASYNPAMAPFVTHDEGTNLVVDHIEKYVAPTISSADLTLPPPTLR